jgi:prevent-host-death family protein
MTKANAKQFTKDVSNYLAVAQKEHVIVTRNGRPLALLIGLENKDAEDFRYMTSGKFWRMIEETRRMPTIPLETVKTELFGDKNSSARNGRKKAPSK